MAHEPVSVRTFGCEGLKVVCVLEFCIYPIDILYSSMHLHQSVYLRRQHTEIVYIQGQGRGWMECKLCDRTLHPTPHSCSIVLTNEATEFSDSFFFHAALQSEVWGVASGRRARIPSTHVPDPLCILFCMLSTPSSLTSYCVTHLIHPTTAVISAH